MICDNCGKRYDVQAKWSSYYCSAECVPSVHFCTCEHPIRDGDHCLKCSRDLEPVRA